MKTLPKLLIATFVFLCQISYAEVVPAFKPVNSLFLAISQLDHEGMKGAVTDDFVLLEHGEVWSIDDLANVVKASEYERTNYFHIIDSKQVNNVAWINYWNKANFDNTKDSVDIVWLESAIAVKDSGRWKLAQMHSTRVEPDRVPENIEFVEQKAGEDLVRPAQQLE